MWWWGRWGDVEQGVVGSWASSARPGAQEEHADDPFAANWPMEQSSQSSTEALPNAGKYRPATHASHSPMSPLSFLNRPRGQMAHSVEAAAAATAHPKQPRCQDVEDNGCNSADGPLSD